MNKKIKFDPRKSLQDEETTVVAIRLPNDQYKLFQKKSREMDVPLSRYVRLFINRSLQRFNETPGLIDQVVINSK